MHNERINALVNTAIVFFEFETDEDQSGPKGKIMSSDNVSYQNGVSYKKLIGEASRIACLFEFRD